MIHGLSIPQRSVRLQYHTLLLEEVDCIFSVQKGVDFDLIDGGFGTAFFDEFLVVFDGVVTNANVADFSFLLEEFEGFVGGDVVVGDGPVDEVEIDVVGAEIEECYFLLACGEMVW